MFNLREFIKSGLMDAAGKLANYQVVLNAIGWYEKGVLLEEDLAEINSCIEKSRVVETPLEVIIEESEDLPNDD